MATLLDSVAVLEARHSTAAVPGVDLGDDSLHDNRTKLEASLFTHRKGMGARQLADGMKDHVLVKGDCLGRVHLRRLLKMDCAATKDQNALMLAIVATFTENYDQTKKLLFKTTQQQALLDDLTEEPFYAIQSFEPGLSEAAALEFQNNLTLGAICEFGSRFFGASGF